MKNILYLTIVLCISICCGFKRDYSKESSSNSKSFRPNDEDFNMFYNQFYSDSIFQRSRIHFPLKGVVKYWDEEDETKIISLHWTPEQVNQISSKQNLLVNYPNLKSELTKKRKTVIEKFWIENSGFSIERRYEVLNHKWYLTYYDLCNV